MFHYKHKKIQICLLQLNQVPSNDKLEKNITQEDIWDFLNDVIEIFCVYVY